MKKLVYGVGLYERGEYLAREGGELTEEYRLWANMLRRCYYIKTQISQPTYVGCTVSKNFQSFQFFASWCQGRVGFGLGGRQLDKDIIVKENKVYSEDTCVFVPKVINNLLISCTASRGEWPVGVCFEKTTGKFVAQCSNGTSARNKLGRFTTPTAAFHAYKAYKELQIKKVAEQYKDAIDPRVYAALLEYKVEITD